MSGTHTVRDWCSGFTTQQVSRILSLSPCSDNLHLTFPKTKAAQPLSAYSTLMGTESVLSTGVRQGFVTPGLLLRSHSDNPDPTKGSGHGTAVLPAE